ncbi:MAG TPA: Ada metal-binding domain-containing protein [Methanothrix sp.]|nr:Ada metal-binding domain-containing protein [Methanothrix sp.]
MLASAIPIGASKYPGPGGDTITDAPMEDFVREENGSNDSNVTEDQKDAKDSKVEPATYPGFDLDIPAGRQGTSKIPVQVPVAGSKEGVPPISVLLNKVVWMEIGNRTLDGSGPYGKLVVNRLPIGSPDFNRLLEDSGYSKVREFENESGSCSWWEDPGAPRLPYGEEEQDLGTEKVQVKRFYVGWAYSKTYHYPDCRWAKNIPLGSQVWFSSPEEARAKGYVPCGTCNPP